MTLELNATIAIIKNFFLSIVSIGRDDFDIYAFEKDLQPNFCRPQNHFNGAFSA